MDGDETCTRCGHTGYNVAGGRCLNGYGCNRPQSDDVSADDRTPAWLTEGVWCPYPTPDEAFPYCGHQMPCPWHSDARWSEVEPNSIGRAVKKPTDTDRTNPGQDRIVPGHYNGV